MRYLFYATLLVVCLCFAERIVKLQVSSASLQRRVDSLEAKLKKDDDTLLIQQLQGQVQDLQNRTGVLEDIKTKIVGAWEMCHMAPQDKSSPTYEFGKYGTFKWTATIAGDRSTWSGTYRINGNVIRMMREDGEEWDLEIKALSDTTLILRNPSKAENPSVELKRKK